MAVLDQLARISRIHEHQIRIVIVAHRYGNNLNRPDQLVVVVVVLVVLVKCIVVEVSPCLYTMEL
jgi:hypothetical protein